MDNEPYNPIEDLAETEPSIRSEVSESFSQQVYEAAESAVGAEGPLNKNDAVELEASPITNAEGDDIPRRERSPERHEPLQETPPQTEAAALPQESQRKVPQSFLSDRIHEICRSPMTWRILKGLLLVMVAIKIYQSLDTIEEYISNQDFDYGALKQFFSSE